MHGYFISLKLYDAARIIANPFIYAEHREKTIRQKLEKLADSRIRTKPNTLPKINRALAERLMQPPTKKKRKRDEEEVEHGRHVDARAETNGEVAKEAEPSGLLADSRFKAIFEDPEYEIDETSREFALLHPSQAEAAMKKGKVGKTKTAVDKAAEEDSAGGISSDDLGLGGSSSEEDSEEEQSGSGSGERMVHSSRAADIYGLQTWRPSVCTQIALQSSTLITALESHCLKWCSHDLTG